MTTTIDNNQRRFWLHNMDRLDDQDIICNLNQLHDAYDKQNVKGICKIVIRELWNNKWKRVSKKHINEMLSANGLEHIK